MNDIRIQYMQKKMTCLFFMTVFFLSGCASLDGVESIFSHITTSDKTSYSSRMDTANQESNFPATEGSFSFDSKLDVDVVFAALRHEFDFRSPEQLNGLNGDWHRYEHGYRWDTNPGSYYRVSYSNLNHNDYPLFLDMAIQKKTSGCKVIMNYTFWGPAGGIQQELLNRSKNALK